jgi:integrase
MAAGNAACTAKPTPALDMLLLRFHTETACRRGVAPNLRPVDLDERQCLVKLREGGTERWRPVSPTLMRHLLAHRDERGDGNRRSHRRTLVTAAFSDRVRGQRT